MDRIQFFPYSLDALNHAIIMTGSFLPPYTREEKLSFGLRLLGSNPGRPRRKRVLYPLLHGLSGINDTLFEQQEALYIST